MSEEAVAQKMAELSTAISAHLSELQTKKEELMREFKARDDWVEFGRKPYAILPKRQNEYWVISPKFAGFNIGWLDHSDETYNYSIINRYMGWLSSIPDELKGLFKFDSDLSGVGIEGDTLVAPDIEKVWPKVRSFVNGRQDGKIKITHGREFALISYLISQGELPFIPRPVEVGDMEESLKLKQPIQLRDYQLKAAEAFKQYGAIGVFWPPSAGKTIIGLWALSLLKGKKLIVVPSVTLKEQWEKRIGQYLASGSEIEVLTYAAQHKMGGEYALAIFDECHRLPANTYAKLSAVRAKYRIGLSATPYREDGRTDLIFALTGFPIGADWSDLEHAGVFKVPKIRLYVCEGGNAKFAILKRLLEERKKTLIFCDYIQLGERIARTFNVPFISGQTSGNRLAQLEKAEVAVVSRVGDEGISLPDLQRTIEVAFLFGSRRQEAQRIGRNLHSKGKGEHVIIMTEAELASYEKRLYTIKEKGWSIEIVRS